MVKKLKRKIRKTDWGKIVNIYDFFSLDPKKIHTAQLVAVIDRVPLEHSALLFKQLPYDVQYKVFPRLKLKIQHKIIRHSSMNDMSRILDHIGSDDRIAFLEELSTIEQSLYMSYLTPKHKQETQELLGYDEDSVARLVDKDFATVHQTMTVGEVGEYLRENFHDTEAINVIYVVDDDGKLLDDIQARKLVLNKETTKISDIMDGKYAVLHIDDSQEKAVQKFKDYDRVVMPVVNDENMLMGVVTIDDIIDVMEDQQTEDIQKMGGVEALDFPYVQTSLLRLAEKRATWLIILFIGEMLTATAMGYFEDEISTAVVLALFVPLVISSGGNSGSQAATLIIRALAVKELSLRDWRFVMKREILSGLILGTILGTIGFIRITLWEYLGRYDYGEHWLLIAFTIFLSLIGIVLWGTLSGSMVPLLLKRLKLDPATSSAPFVATLVDVTGLVIYFSIAAMVLKGTLL